MTPFRASTTARPRPGVQAPAFAGRITRLAAGEIVADPVPAIRVIAERYHVRAGGEQALCELRGDAGAVGDVLAVHDADVCVELRAQSVQPVFDSAPAGDAEDIREEEDSQFRTSVAAGRSSIETWLPASFV